MKTRFFTLLAALLLSSFAGAQTYDTNTLTNGLVAYYPLQGNGDDYSGNSQNCVIYGAKKTTNRFGKIDGAYEFFGNEYLLAKKNIYLPLGSSSRTLSVWAKTQNYPLAQHLVNWGSAKNGKAFGIITQIDNYFWMYGYNLDYRSSMEINGDWNQVVITYDINTLNNDNIQIYINGKSQNGQYLMVNDRWFSGNYKYTLDTEGQDLLIGCRNDFDFFYIGDLSDIRIYNRALSSDEVEALYAMESTPPVTTDTFGSGTNQFGIDFVTVGNPGNSNDTTGYGGVPYTYRIGKYTISQNQVDAATRNGLQNVTAGAWSGDQPAANISWYEAAAYVNWLNTSQGYRPAYNLTYTNGAWSMALWPTSPDTNGNVAWTLGGTNLFRNALCHYFLPSENEWYKAAYYDPNKNGSSGYWKYAILQDNDPIAVSSGTSIFTVVYLQPWGSGPASIYLAGTPSAYGTIGQTGNVGQWTETSWSSLNNNSQEPRVVRGGAWGDPARLLQSTWRYSNFGYPAWINNCFGFRIASQEELTTTNTQSISFPTIPTLTLTNGAYVLGATSDSGLAVSYAIGDSTVAGITNGTLIPLGVGTTTVVASQAGDTNYLPATPVTNTLVVTLAQQVVTPSPVATRTYGSLPFGLILPTNSTGLPITTRIVSGPATLSGTNIIITGTGTVTLAYEAPSNALYAAASVTNSFTVTNGPTNFRSQTITFKAFAAKAYGSAPQALAGSASSKLPVTYWSSNTNVAVINGTNAVITGAGSAVITAYQPGDGSTFNPAAPVSQTLLVNQSAQKLTLKAPKSVAYGAAPAAITAISSAGLPVTLTSSDPTIATITNNGTNSLLVPTGVGTITLTATQAGNTNVGAAIPVGQSIVISPGIQTITFGALATNTYGAAPIILTATSSAGLPVSFTSAATNVASISGDTLTIMGAGSAKITASQAGSRLWAPAKAVTQTLTVAKASQTILFTPPSTVRFTNGGLVTLGATASSGLPVAYKSGNSKVLSITGSTCVITGRGTTTVVASQPGGANYLPATAITNTITVQ